MLFVIIFTLFAFLQSCLETKSLATEAVLKTLNEKAQQEASTYKELVASIQTQAQGTITPKSMKPKEAKEGRCYQGTQHPLGSCLKKRQTQTSNESPLLADKTPIIFVSASMPLPSLKTLAYQAQKYQAKLVIRGMVKGSMKETADLVRVIGHPLDIDPKLFQTYSIQKVPVFLVHHQDQGRQGQWHQNRWHKVQGNVDLLFALEKAKEKSLGNSRPSS